MAIVEAGPTMNGRSREEINRLVKEDRQAIRESRERRREAERVLHESRENVERARQQLREAGILKP